MESNNATMNGSAQNQSFEVEPQVAFQEPNLEQAELGQGEYRVGYLGNVENPQPWEQGQGNFGGEFLGDIDAAQCWGAEAGELQVGFGGGAQDNNGEMLALGEFTGYAAPMAAPVSEFATELPAAYNGWEVAAPASGCVAVPPTPMNWVMGAPENIAMALPPQPMYPVAPLMGFPTAPPMAPTGYMITTVVAPLTPPTSPMGPSLAFPPMGRVYQILEDGYSGLGVPPGI